MDVFLDSQPLAPESPQAVNCPSRSAFGRSFPSIAPALFLSFCAPVHTLEEAPLALAHVVGMFRVEDCRKTRCCRMGRGVGVPTARCA